MTVCIVTHLLRVKLNSYISFSKNVHFSLCMLSHFVAFMSSAESADDTKAAK